MKRYFSWFLGLFCLSLIPVPTFAQCRDQHDRACWSLQYILYAAETDFREFRGSKPLRPGDPKPNVPSPDLSVRAIRVPCHTDMWWSSVVAVYMCSAEIPAAEAEEWYGKTMGNLHQLQYLWEFKGESPGEDHYIDAGPAGCEVAALDTRGAGGNYPWREPYVVDGPYMGQCPLHLQVVKQGDGTAKVSFWLNSYTSANLARNPGPPAKSLEESAKAQPLRAVAPSPGRAAPVVESSAAVEAPAAAPAAGKNPEEHVSANHAGCDALCQGLKKILEDRTSSFKEFGGGSGISGSATAVLGPPVKLSGAGSCLLKSGPSVTLSSAKNGTVSAVHLARVSAKGNHAGSSVADATAATQYVCYWPQASELAAESQFFDLVGLLQVLIPSSWSAQQKIEADELSGAQMTVWSARDARNKTAVGLYLSGKSVGLHVSAGQ